MNSKKASFMIGMAQKAGKVSSGEFSAEKAIRAGHACLVVISEDASENTRKKFLNMASWRNVPVKFFLTKAELGRITGKGERSCLVITERGLAEAVKKALEDDEVECSRSGCEKST